MIALVATLLAMSQTIPDSVLLKGAEEFTWGVGSMNSNSVAGTLAATMMMLGETKYDYPYLMGVSGQAFRLQVWDGDAKGT